MGCAVMRYETRRRVTSPLLNHYDGTRRPEHARTMPAGEAVKPLLEHGASGDVTAKKAREAAKRHKAQRLPGKPPAPLVDALFAGPPPYTSAHAWSDDMVKLWAMDTLGWLAEKVMATSEQALVTGAWLHCDERSPHLHVCLVPALDDGTLGWGKVQRAMGLGGRATCEAVSRAEMSESMSALQDSYWEKVGRQYGLERGQKGSKRRHHRPIHDAPMPVERARGPRTPSAILDSESADFKRNLAQKGSAGMER